MRAWERRAGVAAAAGYSVVELTLVIVILAVLAAVAGPRFFDNRAFSERGYADELTSAIRYAQKVAAASGCRVRVDLGASSYVLSQQAALGGHCDPSDSGFPLPVRLATGQAASGAAPAGVTLAAPLVLTYDALGRTDLPADQTLTVGSRSLTIHADSGLVSTP